jgi:hypothetical protein
MGLYTSGSQWHGSTGVIHSLCPTCLSSCSPVNAHTAKHDQPCCSCLHACAYVQRVCLCGCCVPFRFPQVSAADKGTETDTNQNQQLCYHVLGQPQSQDVVVLADPDHPVSA